MKIQGSVALVTGANRGLGKAIAQALLAAGAAKVYAAARDPETVDFPGVEPIQLDVADAASVAAAAQRAGDVQIVINNAGISVHGPALAAGSADSIRRHLDTNLFGVLNVSSAFAPIVGRNGGGAFVNVLSALSWLTLDGTTPYSISKSAAWALTNGMRQELKAQGTLVSSLHVGYMDTDMTAAIDAPKTAPADVAAQIVAALEAGQTEITADEVTRDVKASLGTATAAYL